MKHHPVRHSGQSNISRDPTADPRKADQLSVSPPPPPPHSLDVLVTLSLSLLRVAVQRHAAYARTPSSVRQQPAVPFILRMSVRRRDIWNEPRHPHHLSKLLSGDSQLEAECVRSQRTHCPEARVEGTERQVYADKRENKLAQ